MANVLYIVMRNDLESLVGTSDARRIGKACAQASHAANQFVHEARNMNDLPLSAAIEQWESETGRGFGTCIVLGASGADMVTVVRLAKSLGHHAGVIHDPTYPLTDGDVVHFIPLDTCGYVFGDKDALRPIVWHLPLLF